LEEARIADSHYEDYVVKEDLHKAFLRFCRKNKLPPKTDIEFGREISRLGILVSGRESKGARRTIWRHIRLTAEYLLEREQYALSVLNT
jgi:hypothetical protein